jgi:putative membrane protein
MLDHRLVLVATLACAGAMACKSHDNASTADSAAAATSATPIPATPAPNDSTSKSTAPSTAAPVGAATNDAGILAKAQAGDSGEVALGSYMATNATDANVKAYAKLIERDHGKGISEVESVAKKLGVTMQLPAGDTTAQAASSALDHLKSLSGMDRDTAFLNHEIEDHRVDINDAKLMETTAQSPEVKALLKKELPELQKHLDRAKQLSTELGKKKS